MTQGALSDAHHTIQAHSKSFSLAARFLPPRIRDRAVVLYAWCRRADDFVDQVDDDEARERLQMLRAELDAIYAGQQLDHPLLDEFQRIVTDSRVPRDYPEELLAGLAMDVDEHSYETLEDLLHYCYRVAGTVGLMMCHVMGIRDEGSLRNAVHLGIAMQITNICRDVLEDWERGRLYLPARMLRRYGIDGLDPERDAEPPTEARAAIRECVRELLAEADRFYRSGDEGMLALAWRCSLSIRTAREVYAAIGDRLREMGHDPLLGRAIVPRRRKLALVGQAMGYWAAEIPARLRDGLTRRPGPTHPPARTVRFPKDILPLVVACQSAR